MLEYEVEYPEKIDLYFGSNFSKSGETQLKVLNSWVRKEAPI